MDLFSFTLSSLFAFNRSGTTMLMFGSVVLQLFCDLDWHSICIPGFELGKTCLWMKFPIALNSGCFFERGNVAVPKTNQGRQIAGAL